MGGDDFGHRVSRLSALAEPVRRALYRFVVTQPGPVSRDQASDGVGVARHTAKFHLDKLVDEGLLTTEFRRLTGRSGPGAGRPTKLYSRSPQEVAVSVPERHYALAGQLMARAIDDAARTGTDVMTALRDAAAQHGRTLGGQVADAAGPGASRTAVLDAVCSTLAAQGYEPRLADGVVTLANCPFHTLAREHTALVCGMNLALLSHVADESSGGLTATLDPEPGRCCVTLAAD
ncbi:MAG TPA: helix-turn-helix domain-containing protein [Actinomycetes bacterium]